MGMSNFLIAFLFSIGAATWIYNKTYSRTGGNTKSAIIVAAAAGGTLFLAMLLLLEFIGNLIG